MGFGFRGSGDQTRQMIRELAQARPVTDAQRQYLAGPGPDGTAPTGYGSFDVTAELTADGAPARLVRGKGSTSAPR